MKANGHSDAFAHSMTDLMAGVAVIFLVLAAIFMVQSARAAEQQREQGRLAERSRQALKEATEVDRQAIDALMKVKEELRDEHITYDPDKPYELTVTLADDALFDKGQCEIREAERDKALAHLTNVVGRFCGKALTPHLESILLEGHTDRNPIRGGGERCGVTYRERERGLTVEERGFRNNVRLSAARAQEVFFEAREHLDATTQDCLEKYFVIAGRGPVQPMSGGAWRAPATSDVAADRRVVIKVRVKGQSALQIQSKVTQ